MRYNNWTVTTLTAVLLSASGAAADEWPNWRGPNHDGISKETAWDPAAVSARKVAWEAEVGAGYSAVAVTNGKVYTAGNFNKNTDAVSCLDAASGKQLWRHEYPEPLAAKFYSGGCSATPTVHDGKVYFASKSGKVFCLDADTGKVIWNKQFGCKVPTWGFASSALIHGKAAIFNAGRSGMAYDKASGAVLWSSEDDACGYATPVPFEQSGKPCFALFAKDTISAVAADGKALWSYPWQTQHDVNVADPIIVGTQVFITSGYGRGASVVDFAGAVPKKVWENKNMRSHMSGPVLIGGYLYGFDDNRLTCLDWKTGEQKWNEKSPAKGALMAAGDKLIVLGETGRLAIAKATPTAYQELAAAEVLDGRCWTMPILAGGRIHVRNSDGHLVCLDVRKKPDAP
ncbi:MAG: PQQ-binding-like beta-propeller repeat protein [Verrucomicrobia bacterium]|nr:PQQ-binding-like beta-propeller repeat protein [Verrucomicrobiota bacterium]